MEPSRRENSPDGVINIANELLLLLEKEERQALLLKFYCEKTSSDVGKIMQIDIKNVHDLLRSGTRKLVTKLIGTFQILKPEITDIIDIDLLTLSITEIEDIQRRKDARKLDLTADQIQTNERCFWVMGNLSEDERNAAYLRYRANESLSEVQECMGFTSKKKTRKICFNVAKKISTTLFDLVEIPDDASSGD